MNFLKFFHKNQQLLVRASDLVMKIPLLPLKIIFKLHSPRFKKKFKKPKSRIFEIDFWPLDVFRHTFFCSNNIFGRLNISFIIIKIILMQNSGEKNDQKWTEIPIFDSRFWPLGAEIWNFFNFIFLVLV